MSTKQQINEILGIGGGDFAKDKAIKTAAERLRRVRNNGAQFNNAWNRLMDRNPPLDALAKIILQTFDEVEMSEEEMVAKVKSPSHASQIVNGLISPRQNADTSDLTKRWTSDR